MTCKEDPLKDTSQMMIERLVSIGRAQQILGDILDGEIFNTLSKHNSFWNSDHEESWDKLHKMRGVLIGMQESLYDLRDVLHPE